MKKNWKRMFVAFCMVVLFVASGIFAACDNKKPDDIIPDNPPQKHECESKCPVCGKCLDMDCEQPVCSVKCGDSKEYEKTFDSVDMNVAKSGMKLDDSRSYYIGFTKSNQGSIVFAFESEHAVKASLLVSVSKGAKDETFTSSVKTIVNGKEITSKSLIPAVAAGKTGYDFALVNLGCIDLAEGKNIISFSAQTNAERAFKNIKIASDETLTTVQADPLPHECTSVCSICGGCTNFSCLSEGCENKCTCQSGGDPATIFTVLDGHVESNREINAEFDGIGAVWEQTATIKFNINSSVAGKVKYGIVVSATWFTKKVTDHFTVTVNGNAAESSESMLPFCEGKDYDWNNYSFVFVGEFNFVEGKNTVIISQTPTTNQAVYNFQSLVLFGNGEYSWWTNTPDQPDQPENPHECTSVCEVCKGCTNKDCTEEACAKKCSCTPALPHVEHIFKVTEAKVTSNMAVNAEGTAIGCSWGQETWIQFVLSATEREVVELGIVVSADVFDIKATDHFTIKLNGTQIAASEAKLPLSEYAWTDWNAFSTVKIGEVTLEKGNNVIRVSQTPYYGGAAYNFQSLVIYGNGEYNLVHNCENVCETCNGCKNFSCFDESCATKCTCEGGGKATVFSAITGKVTSTLPVNDEKTGIQCTYGVLSSVEFNIDSATACTVKIAIVVSSDTSDNKATDHFAITVNDAKIADSETKLPQSVGYTGFNEYKLVVIGEINLVEGNNKIVFTQTAQQGSAYNFQSMVLFGEGTFTWAE